jgi:NADH dehydrogenase FAD-containing subunit
VVSRNCLLETLSWAQLLKSFNEQEKNAFAFNPVPSLRASIIPGWEDKVLYPLDTLFPSSSKNLVFSGVAVTGITKDTVKLEKNVTIDGVSTDTISFAYLVIATGSRSAFPIRVPMTTDLEEAKTAFRDMQKQTAEAKKVLIIGGGPVGFEAAGEITEYYNGSNGREKKDVTLVSLLPKLLHPDAKDSVHQKCLNALTKSGVKVILGHGVQDFNPNQNGYLGELKKFTLDNGEIVEADYVLAGVGPRANTNLVAEAFGEAALDLPSRQVRVRQTLQLVEYDNIFAAGDITNIKENKMAAWGAKHAAVIAGNINGLINNTPLKDYSPMGGLVMLASYGTSQAYGQLPFGFSLPSWLGARLKSKTLFSQLFPEMLNIKSA